MGVTPETQRRLDEQKRLIEQIIRDPTFQLDGVFFDPYTPYLRSNNFVQQTASRIFGFNTGIKKWFPLSTDSLGRVLLSSDPIDGAQIFLKDRNFTDAVVMDGVVVPASSSITHDGVDVSSLSRKSVLISSSGDVTVRVQFSHNNADWFQWFDTNDVEVTIAVNNAKKNVEVVDPAHYMRIFVTNTSSLDSTVTGVIVGLT